MRSGCGGWETRSSGGASARCWCEPDQHPVPDRVLGVEREVIVRPGDAVFLTDSATSSGSAAGRFIEVKQVNQEILAPAAEQLGSMLATGATAGFEGDHLSHDRHQALARELDGPGLTSMSGAVERLRVVKDDDELAVIRRAAALLEPVTRGWRAAGWVAAPNATWPAQIIELLARGCRRPLVLRHRRLRRAGRAAARRARGRGDPRGTSSRSTSARWSTATARIAPAPSPPATSPTRWPMLGSCRPRSRPASTPCARRRGQQVDSDRPRA